MEDEDETEEDNENRLNEFRGGGERGRGWKEWEVKVKDKQEVYGGNNQQGGGSP